ncbi:MAG: hypothetical protein K2G07_08260, partial [Muribaculaceae bacterium]|nr:hypothetical protein [Muribaculaceae bacterium]
MWGWRCGSYCEKTRKFTKNYAVANRRSKKSKKKFDLFTNPRPKSFAISKVMRNFAALNAKATAKKFINTNEKYDYCTSKRR